MPMTADSRRHKPLLRAAYLPLLMLAWGLWLHRLTASDLTFDEAATYYVAHRPLLDILRYLLTASREHPPVYYLLIRLWMTAAGTGEFSLRFFSVGTGILLLPLSGALARRMTGLPGLATAAILAVTPGMAYYARDARMYGLAALWTLLAANLLFRAWLTPSRPRPGDIAALLAVNVLAAFTHYYLLLAVLVQPLTLLLARRWKPLLTWTLAHIPLPTGVLVWYLVSPGLRATIHGLGGGLARSLPSSRRVLRLLGKMGLSPDLGVNYQLLYFALLLIALGTLLLLWRRRTAGLHLSLMLTVPLALAYLLPQPPVPRYLIFLLPYGALAVGTLCESPLLWSRRPPSWGAGLALTGAVVWSLLTTAFFPAITSTRSDYGHVLRLVKAYARPGDGLLFYGPWQAILFRYYDPGGLPPITALPPHAPPLLKPEEAEPVLEHLMDEYERLWVLPAAVDDVDPAHFVYRWLALHAHPVWREQHFGLYLPPLPPDAPTQTVGWGDALRLERVTREPAPLLPGEPLRLTFFWRPTTTVPPETRLTLELRDERGHIWQIARSTPGEYLTWSVGEVITDREGLLIPQGAPPGEYTIRLTVDRGGDVAGADILRVAVEDFAGRPGEPVGPYRLYLPLILAHRDAPTTPRPGPVLYGLPFADRAAEFCGPDGSPCLRLAGYEPGGVRFQQGYPVPLTLHWLSPAEPLPELRVRLQAVRKSPLPWVRPAVLLTKTLPLAPTYPAPRWSPERLVTLPLALSLPPDAPTGSAEVVLAVLDADGHPWLTADGADALPLFEIEIESRPVLRHLPAGLTPVAVDFGAEVGLRGYRLDGEPCPGGELHITYAWYARERPQAIYAVFNHLLTADDETLVAQVDGWPQGGRMLTTQWQAGEYIVDEYRLTIPADAPTGPYVLYVGMYRAADGVRLPASQEGQPLPANRFPIPLEDER